MKARLYLDGVPIGEVDLSHHVSMIRPGACLTLAVIEPHPPPAYRPLFISGPLETAAPMRVTR